MVHVVSLQFEHLVCGLLGEKLHGDALVVEGDLTLFSHGLALESVFDGASSVLIY